VAPLVMQVVHGGFAAVAKIRVSKVEAARRQIDAAIRMLFSNEDPVAVLSLRRRNSIHCPWSFGLHLRPPR
jgi:hypothetical protein